jgi:hypothetical protein
MNGMMPKCNMHAAKKRARLVNPMIQIWRTEIMSRRIGIFVAMLCMALFCASANYAETNGKSDSAENTRKESLRREGTKLQDQRGQFQISGDRVLFVPEGASSTHGWKVLENLALERVLENLNESRVERKWIINGTIMEHRGNNLILLTRAVIELQTPEKTSE